MLVFSVAKQSPLSGIRLLCLLAALLLLPIAVSADDSGERAFTEARALFSQGRYSEALEAFTLVRATYPLVAPKAQRMIGACYQWQGDYESALDAYERLLTDYPASEAAREGHFWLGACYEARAQYAEALAEYQSQLSSNPEVRAPETFHKLATRHRAMGERETADTYFTRLRTLNASSNRETARRAALLEGRSPNGFTTYQLLATTGGDALSRVATPVLAYPDLTNQVDCFLPLIIHWYADAGGWKYGGTSSNNLYVTLAQPMSDARLESFFDISCKAAKGQTTQDGTFEAIWEQGGFGAAFDVKNVRGERLGYYRKRGSCFEGCPYTTAQELVVHTDGQCGAWMELLRSCAGAHGIDTQRVRVEPDPDALPADCLYTSPLAVLGRFVAQDFRPAPRTASECCD